MECAWTTIPFSVGGNYLTLSTTNVINPQASIAWSGSGSVPLFSVAEGQLTFKYDSYIDFFFKINLFI
jgi:hypothetical protein